MRDSQTILQRIASAILLIAFMSVAACGLVPSTSLPTAPVASNTPPGDQQATLQALRTASASTPSVTPTPTTTSTPSASATPTPTQTQTATPVVQVEGPFPYGESYLGYPLLYYRIGHGPRALMLVGGIHGGYELNTVILMNEMLDALDAEPQYIPSDVTLYVVPCCNPDGAVGGPERLEGRFNGNQVDLNRNWDYMWQPMSTHGSQPVSGGSAPFSEPESAALRDLILDLEIEAVIIYHSAMAAVFQGVGTETSDTVELALLLVQETGYRYAPTEVDYPPTTGNAIDWLTVNGITAAEIELTNHTDIDWDINWRALLAFLSWRPQD